MNSIALKTDKNYIYNGLPLPFNNNLMVFGIQFIQHFFQENDNDKINPWCHRKLNKDSLVKKVGFFCLQK